MSNKTMTRSMHDLLLRHAAKVESSRELLINEHYTEDTEESINIKSFFLDYVSAINGYLKNVKITESEGGRFPFAIIGSIVEVQDLDDQEVYKYVITPPFSKDAITDADCASCLSPLGKALLLKSTDDKVNISVPAGTLRYIIKSITLPEHMYNN